MHDLLQLRRRRLLLLRRDGRPPRVERLGAARDRLRTRRALRGADDPGRDPARPGDALGRSGHRALPALRQAEPPGAQDHAQCHAGPDDLVLHGHRDPVHLRLRRCAAAALTRIAKWFVP
ncbi:hypothetical protein CP983_26875 [Streptomyces chartreusis]|nr:hypothetical protein CP983_26875 [Streptomyces chartreusis]